MPECGRCMNVSESYSYSLLFPIYIMFNYLVLVFVSGRNGSLGRKVRSERVSVVREKTIGFSDCK